MTSHENKESYGKKSWKWNEYIPVDISIQDSMQPIYYICRPTGFSE